MGDRANVNVKDGKGDGVYLYTHWGGANLPVRVHEALGRRLRWDDYPYLTRIIFDGMTREHHGSETGHGISSRVQDGDDRVIVVDCRQQTVTMNGRSVSFEEWVTEKPPEWEG